MIRKKLFALLYLFIFSYTLEGSEKFNSTEPMNITFEENEAVFDQHVDTDKDVNIAANGFLKMDFRNSKGLKTKGKLKINAKRGIQILGKNLCTIIASEGPIVMRKSSSNSCLIIAVKDIAIHEELINSGSVIAGGKIIVDGKEWNKRGFHNGGFYDYDLYLQLLEALMEGRYHHIYQLIPRSYIGVGGNQLFTIPKDIADRLYIAFLNASDEQGVSLLMYMAEMGNYEGLVWLLDQGANPYKKDKLGYTAVDYANRKGEETIVKYLLMWITKHAEEEFNSSSNEIS